MTQTTYHLCPECAEEMTIEYDVTPGWPGDCLTPGVGPSVEHAEVVEAGCTCVAVDPVAVAERVVCR